LSFGHFVHLLHAANIALAALVLFAVPLLSAAQQAAVMAMVDLAPLMRAVLGARGSVV